MLFLCDELHDLRDKMQRPKMALKRFFENFIKQKRKI